MDGHPYDSPDVQELIRYNRDACKHERIGGMDYYPAMNLATEKGLAIWHFAKPTCPSCWKQVYVLDSLRY